jgi:hypothetical protein
VSGTLVPKHRFKWALLTRSDLSENFIDGQGLPWILDAGLEKKKIILEFNGPLKFLNNPLNQMPILIFTGLRLVLTLVFFYFALTGSQNHPPLSDQSESVFHLRFLLFECVVEVY